MLLGYREVAFLLRLVENDAVQICTREEPLIYISGRPFVLREASHPKRNLSISNRAENLECACPIDAVRAVNAKSYSHGESAQIRHPARS